MSTVVLTDYPWPDDAVERAVLGAAGHTLVCGPSVPAPADAIEALVQANSPAAILTCWAPVTARVIAAAPELAVIGRMGVGLDNIDVPAAAAQGVLVTNVPDYCFEEVSDHAIALLLALNRDLHRGDVGVKAGAWEPGRARPTRFRELTIGLFGYGRIGRCVAGKLAGFGVRLLAHSRSGGTDGVAEPVNLPMLLSLSDAILITAPLNEDSHHLFGESTLAAMKPGALLINVSRGPIVDNAALAAALQSGRLSGAGLDVVEGEPEPPRWLVDRPDVIVTPHMAFSSRTATLELRTRACEEVIRVLAGEPAHNPCNAPASRPTAGAGA